MQEANESLLKKAIHFGCSITLSYRDENGRIFYATCEGFTSSKLRLRSAKYIKSNGLLASCLFKLVPPFQYTEYQKSKSLFKQKEQLQHVTTIDQRDSRMDFPKQIKLMEDEASLNAEQYNKLKGQSIFYGQTIQFIHQQSNKYLSFDSQQVSDYESDGWKATLKQEHGEDTFFKFLSSFSFQQETGGYIFDEDTVYIVSVMESAAESGMHASEAKEDRNKNLKRELNVTAEKKSFWKIKIFSKHMEESQGYLEVFDVVWISFAEQNLNLVVQKYTPNQNKKFLKFDQGLDTEKYNKFVGDSNGMFVIENIEDPSSDQFTAGGYVEWKKFYCLRHLTSKYYLQLEHIEDINIPGYRLVAVPDVLLASRFQFELIYSTINSKELALQYLEKDSYFRLNILQEDQPLWFRIESTPPNNIYIIEGENFIEDISIPVFHDEKRDENVFKLARASINDVRLTQCLLSCMKTLKRSEEYLAVDLDQTEKFKESSFQLVYRRLVNRSKNLEDCLNDLTLLCYNKLPGYVEFEAEYGQVYDHIQNLLKEQYFFEVLVRILVLCFPTVETLEAAVKIKRQENVTTVLASNQAGLLEEQIKARFIERKKSVCSKVYGLIKGMCQDNIKNQQYCSKYLPIFSMQSMYLPGAMNTIIAIVRGYEELLLTLSKQNVNLQRTIESIKSPGSQSHKASKKKKTNLFNVQRQEINYQAQYTEICDRAKDILSNFNVQWDLIMFFSKMLTKKSQLFEKRIEILQFFKEAAQYEGKGININQELTYKYLLSSGNIFEDEVLIRVKSDGPQLKVYRGGDEKTLLDYFHQHRQKQIDQHFIPYICESMRLYAIMSNSRNYTWKKFAENFFNVESLIENIQNNQYEVEVRSIICNLLNKLYVDQEPRRIILWPELCKVVRTDKRSRDLNNTMLSESKFLQKESQQRADPVDLNKVKEKIMGYLRDMSKRVDANCALVDLSLGPNEKKETLMKIYEDSPSIYNALTIEVIRLFKLLILFGKYSIRLGNTREETVQNNQELFTNIKSMVCLLEFNTMYPETRKILLQKRLEDEQKGKINLQLDIFGSKKAKKPQEELKVVYKGDDDVDDPSQGEGFQKLVSLQQIRMEEFMYKQQNQADTTIKLEICEILDHYLDSKMDFYLNNLKLIFTDWVGKLDIFDKVYREELDIDFPSHRETIQDQFRQQIKKQIQNILPKIMLTGSSVDDTDLAKPDENQFMAFMNLANKMMQNEDKANPKELEDINLERIVNFSIFPSLISIFCLNQNIELETKILSILTRLYNQRYEFADLARQLLLLFDDTNINIFKKCKKKIQLLGKCVDESETWVQNLGSDPQHVHTLEIVQEHFQFFTELLFKGSYINEHQELEKGTGQVDPIRQDIMKHLKVDKLGVDLIKDSVFMVDQETDPIMLDKLKGMFRVCLRFLTLFVKNNPNNQLIMSKYIISLNTTLQTDLGQVELLCEIFRDNKKICTELAHEVIDDFVKLILANGRQSRYLDFFLVTMQIKTDYIPQNQKAVLNLFIDPRFKNQLFYMIPQQPFPVFDFEARQSDTNPNYRDEPFEYHAKFIQVCAACTIGKEGLLSSENKLKAQLTFKYIMELLLADDLFTNNVQQVEEDKFDQVDQFTGSPNKNYRHIYNLEGITVLKPSLLDLLFYTYLESEKISEEIFKCIGDINSFLKKERMRIQSIIDWKHQYQDYLFNNLMLVLNGFIKVFNRELGQQAIQIGTTLQKQVIQFQNELEQMRAALSPAFTSKFKLSKRQETLLDLFINEAIMQEDQNKMNSEDQLQMQKMKEERSRQPTIKKLPKKQKTIQTSKRELSIDQIWKELWTIFLSEFLNSKELSDEIEFEQQIFAKAVYKVDELFKNDKTIHQQINKTQIFKRLIAFLEKSSAQTETITTFKLILKVLRNYISITDIDEDIPEEEQEALKQEQKANNQNFLNSNNAMQMTLTLLSDYSDPKNAQLIFNDLICFGIDLLEGGNNEVQKAVWSYFQSFPSSEVFFMRLHNEFRRVITNINKVDENIVLFAFQQQPDLMKNILRFLQLFAEGHYTVLQEYMHYQSFNHYSYDLIQDFIELLGAYMSCMNSDYFENMIQNFDTITEYIQGPCRINQSALIKANFLDLANQLYSYDELLDELQENVEESNFQEKAIELLEEQLPSFRKRIPRWMYAMLKYKCSVTLISLLEARENDEIVQKMMKSLNPETLKTNIANVYYQFQSDYDQTYDEDIFQHFSLEPTEENQPKLQFIMETGFNLYFLQTIFQKTKDPLFGRKKKGENGEGKEDDELSSTLNDNIIMRILKLVKAIVQSLQESTMGQLRVDRKNEKRSPQEKLDAFLKARNDVTKASQDFFFSKTGSIEIMFDDKRLEETFFYIPPYCSLDDEAKTKFNENANRASNKAKVTSLVNASKELIKTMKLNHRIQVYLNKIKTLQVIIENIDLLRDIEFLLALTINVLIFLLYRKQFAIVLVKPDTIVVPDTSQTDEGEAGEEALGEEEAFAEEENTEETEIVWSDSNEFREIDDSVINGLGTLSIVLSILIVAFFLSRNAPLLIEKAWSGVGKDKLNLLNYLIRLLKTIYYFISDFFILYYILYGMAAVLGRFLHPFFFAFHLFEVLIRFPVLLNVVKSVWIPKEQILYTGLLLLIFMYVFTVFSYLILYDSHKPNFCETMWTCFLTVLDSAFKYDSGIGGQLNNPHETYGDSYGMLIVRFFYDNFFNILVVIVMLNILQGIIIDQFGELREKLAEYRNDLENNCFICGHDKETIEKESTSLQNFEDHIRYEHYQWNYLFYIAYLNDKDNTEYTGVESYVAGKLEKEDITWFPLNRALCLNKRKEEENELVKSLETIKENSKILAEQLQEIQQEIQM